MPHKHKRRQKDDSIYDLPPSHIAKSLSVHKPKSTDQKGKKKAGGKNDSKNGAKRAKESSSGWVDDTPRAFVRMMQYQSSGKRPSGLDDGNAQPRGKKRKHGGEDKNGAAEGASNNKNQQQASSDSKKSAGAASSATTLKILPGEKLRDFVARVDQEMPLSAMKKSQGPGPSANLPKIREERITKHEKHLRKLQKGWREDEAKIREKEAEERELKEAENEELNELWKEWQIEAGKAKAKKKGSGAKKKKRKGDDGTDIDDDDDDPWAKLNTRERAAKPMNPLEVVQAPPESLTKPREIFRVRRGVGGAEVDVANVPAAAGSLRRREELAKERKTIVEEYRRLMAEKRR